jgi:hypothetical protein
MEGKEDFNKQVEEQAEYFREPVERLFEISRGNVNFVNYTKTLPKVNPVTFEELLIPLAEELDAYAEKGMGDLEYSDRTYQLFRQLVISMARDFKISAHED